MKKKIIMLIMLMGISFALTSCKQEEYPIELTKTMNEILEENDDWECYSEGCGTYYITDLAVFSKVQIVEELEDAVIQNFGISSDLFWGIKLRYHYLSNDISAYDIFGRDYQGTCKIIKDDMICDEGMPEFSDEAIERIIEFKNYIDDIVEDYKK